MTNRYIKQTYLPEIGEEGQKKLQNASVLCVGAGGLGSPALLYLAASGIGNIGIIDLDTVDETNLQRQILFTTDKVGHSKAIEAKNHLQRINPDIHIRIYQGDLNDTNASQLFSNYDIILDGSDNFQTKFLINDAAVQQQKPWVYGAIQGFDGQVSLFDSTQGSCYRCLYPEIPKALIANCAESGTLGPVVGLIGVTQALQVMQKLINHESFDTLIGKLWVINTKNMQTRLLNIPKNKNCPTCSKKPSNIRLTYEASHCPTIPELMPLQIHDKAQFYIIDVREKDEWDRGYIDKATLHPLSQIKENKIIPISKETDILLYCQKGRRSLQAARILKAQGFVNVYNLSGGYESWLKHHPKTP